jgi:phospholipid N-methyltransferase
MPKGKYLKNYFKDRMIGAVVPSSRFVIKKILKELDISAQYIVEYGAGDGVITKELLKQLSPEARVVAIEKNKTLLQDLKKIKDPRLVVVDGDVVRVAEDFSQLGIPRVDAVISGIPFSFFKPAIRHALIKNTFHGIAPGGQFIIYQYSFLVFPILRRHFAEAKVSFEPRNFLPYFIMNARK